MSALTRGDRELVALGAAMGRNCVPCIECHIPEARKAGLDDAQISEAIRIADKVRQVPARKVLDAANGILSGAAAGDPDAGRDCRAVAATAGAAARCRG